MPVAVPIHYPILTNRPRLPNASGHENIGP